jgi:hypothetical protein
MRKKIKKEGENKMEEWKGESDIKAKNNKKETNPVALVRKQTIPTERPPLVGEVIANFLQIEGIAWSAQRIPTAVFYSKTKGESD